MNNKKAFVFVESPFQLLCAFEAVNYFNVEGEFFIRLNNNDVNNHQLYNVAKELNIKNINYIFIPQKRYFNILIKTIYLLKIIKLNSYDYYFIGDYLSNFIKQLIRFMPLKKIVLLDDGVATFKVQKELNKNNLPLTLFTIFNIRPINNKQLIIHNSFKALKSRYSSAKKKEIDIFIGGKLINIGLLDSSIYIKILKNTLKDSKGNKILYFPHRGESKKFLNDISNLKNIELVYSELPIELYLLKYQIFPNNIYSIISTVLFSLSIIYEKANIIAYKPIFMENKIQSHINDIYSKMLSHDKVIVKEI